VLGKLIHMGKDIVLAFFLMNLSYSGTLNRLPIIADYQELSEAEWQAVDTSRLQLSWVCTAAFEKLESTVYDYKRDCIYVSNGKQYGPGKDGFISKVSSTGQLMELHWIRDLNRPTGMAIHHDRLYVADVNVLLILDLTSNIILNRIEVPMKYGLNDVAISKDGTVFATASAIHAVLKLEGQTLKVWKQDKELLMWANGIQASPEGLWVGGEHAVQLTFEGEIIQRLAVEPQVRDFEGIAPIGANRFLASTVENSALYLMDDEKSSLLLQAEGYFGDLEFISDKNKLIIVQGNHQKESYSLHCYYLR